VGCRTGSDRDAAKHMLSAPPNHTLCPIIHVEAFDWNCPQRITPRYTEEQIIQLTTPIRQRIADLEAENKRLRAQLPEPTKS
jgi:hypothetical protein